MLLSKFTYQNTYFYENSRQFQGKVIQIYVLVDKFIDEFCDKWKTVLTVTFTLETEKLFSNLKLFTFYLTNA